MLTITKFILCVSFTTAVFNLWALVLVLTAHQMDTWATDNIKIHKKWKDEHNQEKSNTFVNIDNAIFLYLHELLDCLSLAHFNRYIIIDMVMGVCS